jgi:hypothetical protein
MADHDTTQEPTSSDQDDELAVPGLPENDGDEPPITENGDPMPV